MKKAIYILFLLVFSITTVSAQSSSVYGKVTDEETGEELLYANLVLSKSGVFVTGGSTDFEGNFSIPLDPGVYDLKISYTGYPHYVITDVIIKGGQGTKLDIQLKQGINPDSITVTNCSFPLIGDKELYQKELPKNTSIHGKVTDEETGEELLYANIVLNKNGVYVTGGSTDFEGNYSIPLDPGTYDLKISYTGYPDHEITDIIVIGGQETKLDISMAPGVELSCCYGCFYWIVPLINQEDTSTGKTITSEQIRNEPNKNVNELLLSTPGVSIGNF